MEPVEPTGRRFTAEPAGLDAPPQGLPTTRHDVEFSIDLGAINPDVDEILSDGHRAAYAVANLSLIHI